MIPTLNRNGHNVEKLEALVEATATAIDEQVTKRVTQALLTRSLTPPTPVVKNEINPVPLAEAIDRVALAMRKQTEVIEKLFKRQEEVEAKLQGHLDAQGKVLQKHIQDQNKALQWHMTEQQKAVQEHWNKLAAVIAKPKRVRKTITKRDDDGFIAETLEEAEG